MARFRRATDSTNSTVHQSLDADDEYIIYYMVKRAQMIDLFWYGDPVAFDRSYMYTWVSIYI